MPLIIETSVVDPDMASAMGEMSAAVKAMAALLETVGKINLEGMPDEEINAMGRALKAEKERRRSAENEQGGPPTSRPANNKIGDPHV